MLGMKRSVPESASLHPSHTCTALCISWLRNSGDAMHSNAVGFLKRGVESQLPYTIARSADAKKCLVKYGESIITLHSLHSTWHMHQLTDKFWWCKTGAMPHHLTVDMLSAGGFLKPGCQAGAERDPRKTSPDRLTTCYWWELQLERRWVGQEEEGEEEPEHRARMWAEIWADCDHDLEGRKMEWRNPLHWGPIQLKKLHPKWHPNWHPNVFLKRTRVWNGIWGTFLLVKLHAKLDAVLDAILDAIFSQLNQAPLMSEGIRSQICYCLVAMSVEQ